MPKHIKVAICSRDSEENYTWLKDFLENRMCKKTEVKAHPVSITNNTSQFYKDVSGYDFAILYHTKKRGRINITNVTDSLYDQELKYICDKLKKKRVAVVVDDLESSDNSEKDRIIDGQPDLKTHAQDVFLFTVEDKNDNKDERMISKLQELKDCIKEKQEKNKISRRFKKMRIKRKRKN